MGLAPEVGSHILAVEVGTHFAGNNPGEPDPQVVLAGNNPGEPDLQVVLAVAGAVAGADAVAAAGDSGHPAVPGREI